MNSKSSACTCCDDRSRGGLRGGGDATVLLVLSSDSDLILRMHVSWEAQAVESCPAAPSVLYRLIKSTVIRLSTSISLAEEIDIWPLFRSATPFSGDILVTFCRRGVGETRESCTGGGDDAGAGRRSVLGGGRGLEGGLSWVTMGRSSCNPIRGELGGDITAITGFAF